MKKNFIILTLIIMCLVLQAEKGVTLSELMNPRYLVVENGKAIISDYPYLFLYSLKDIRLIIKAGSKGEGPGEFYIPQQNMNLKERGLIISTCPNYITVSSVGRISYFNKNGDFLRFVKTPHGINRKFISLCDKFLGFAPAPTKGKLSLLIFDSNLAEERKILDCDYWFNLGRKSPYNFFDRASDTLLTAVHGNKIFITRGDSPSLVIDVFDFKGDQLFIIKHTVEKIKIPKEFLDRIHKHLKVKYRNIDISFITKNIHLPDCFPAVRDLYATDYKLYVVTFKKQSGNTEVLIFSTNGKFLKKIYLPVKEKNPEQLSPYSFYKNKFYQIVENEKENWELFITPIN